MSGKKLLVFIVMLGLSSAAFAEATESETVAFIKEKLENYGSGPLMQQGQMVQFVGMKYSEGVMTYSMKISNNQAPAGIRMDSTIPMYNTVVKDDEGERFIISCGDKSKCIKFTQDFSSVGMGIDTTKSPDVYVFVFEKEQKVKVQKALKHLVSLNANRKVKKKEDLF